MKNVDRLKATLSFQKPTDRLPIIEWASWWDKTIDRWRGEGLPVHMPREEIGKYLGLDNMCQFWIGPKSHTFYDYIRNYGYIRDRESYLRVKPLLFPADAVESRKDKILACREEHDRGNLVVWLTLDGFFWFPRTILGIENHLYAFYDQPDLMHEMNLDCVAFNLSVIEDFCKILKPEFVTIAEDMSYNLGPMLSQDMFREFIQPHYQVIVPAVKRHGIIPLVDTDGQLEPMIPWLEEAGIEGALPLERQAGVDIDRIRKNHPSFKIIGAFDKMVMHKGEEALRQEFQRLLPVMRSGGFIPSCDHQTPPAVSFEDYRLYLRLLKEYCTKAVEG